MSLLDQLLRSNERDLTQGASTENMEALLAYLPKLAQHLAVQIHLHDSAPPSRNGARTPAQGSGRATPNYFFGRTSQQGSRPASRQTSRQGSRPGTPMGTTHMSADNPFSPQAQTSSPRRHTRNRPQDTLNLSTDYSQMRGRKTASPRSSARVELKKMGAADIDFMAQFKADVQMHCNSDGFADLEAIFREMDSNRDGLIDDTELRDGLAAMHMKIRPREAKRVISIVDTEQRGLVSYDEFLRQLKGCLSKGRVDMIKHAFDTVDPTGDGIAAMEDLVAACTRPGELKAIQKYAEADGTITLDGFLDHYRHMSLNIESDEQFSRMMHANFRFTFTDKTRSRTNNRLCLVTHTDGSKETVEIVNDDLGSNPAPQKLKNHLRRQGCTLISRAEILS